MIVGAADRPLILEVTNGGQIRLTDAAGLWGCIVPETLTALKKRHETGSGAAG